MLLFYSYMRIKVPKNALKYRSFSLVYNNKLFAMCSFYAYSFLEYCRAHEPDIRQI